MLASIFIIQGYDTFRRPERVAAKAEPVVRPIADRVPVVPAKTEQAVRLNGAVQMAAGSLLALGRWPRLSALAIAGTLVPTTLAGHRFWEAEDEGSKAQQRIHFLKNLSMLGGLLIAAADTAGKPSIAWRARHAVKSARRPARPAGRPVQSARKEASRVAGSARREGLLAIRTVKASGKAGARTAKASGKAGAKAGRLAGRDARGLVFRVISGRGRRGARRSAIRSPARRGAARAGR